MSKRKLDDSVGTTTSTSKLKLVINPLSKRMEDLGLCRGILRPFIEIEVGRPVEHLAWQ